MAATGLETQRGLEDKDSEGTAYENTLDGWQFNDDDDASSTPRA